MVEGGGMSYTMSKGARAELSARENVRGNMSRGMFGSPWENGTKHLRPCIVI